MAFKKRNKPSSVPETPVELFRGLQRRQFPTEMPHQRKIIEQYIEAGLEDPDVAIQLPTGSGKTLVGLLIADWRRRKYEEKVLYLCPTRQLVHQTCEQAENNYGLNVLPFVGSKKEYIPGNIAKYNNTNNIAVSTYSSLFNVRPFFDDPDLIIVDDAHASENYIASMWSLEIDSSNTAHIPLFETISSVLRPLMAVPDYQRLVRDYRSEQDATWVDKVPTPSLVAISNDLITIFDEYTQNTDLRYQWSLLRDHIDACHVYLSKGKISIRPLIPPTWDFPAFNDAKQRIFMSATLGEGGDLERLTGRPQITRISVPEGFGLESVGRRYFVFPSMSLPQAEVDTLRLRMMHRAGRSVVLSPSNEASSSITARVEETLGFPIFSAHDIEQGKKLFTETQNAVAAFAGRYDGIDFPHDECRFLCVDGLPSAMNAQERFIMSRMGAHVLFNERIQVRILQAVGRCTRALQDSAAIFVTGSELQDYLTDKKRRKAFYPELQAEIAFGIEQSLDMTPLEFLDNLHVFLEKGDDWEEANAGILEQAALLERQVSDTLIELSAASSHEIKYQKAMWSADYSAAYREAQSVLGLLKHADLRGYRALWHYMAGSAASLAAKGLEGPMNDAARMQFERAKRATMALPWLVKLSEFQTAAADDNTSNIDLAHQVENLEAQLCRLGTTHDGEYAKLERSIMESLASAETFENAQKLLGSLLGFDSDKVESDGSPDPWWISHSFCFVFEDHAGAENTSKLGAGKARQAAGHPNWMKANVPEAENLTIIAILVSPVEKAESGAIPQLVDVSLWPLDAFRAWSRTALTVLREIRSELGAPGDLAWRALASKKLEENRLSANTIAEDRLKNNAATALK